MKTASPRLRLKTRLVTSVVVLANVLGNFFLSRGLKDKVLGSAPFGYIEALFTPWVAVGVTLLVVWMLSRMALLSWADLSYVLPVTSIGYVLAVFMGWFFLLEDVSWLRATRLAFPGCPSGVESSATARYSGGAAPDSHRLP